ncbi:hypothetical protein GCM10023325_08390 [Sphingomonas lutea]
MVTNSQAASPVLPTPEPPLDRAALLLATARAASAAAAGVSDLEAQRTLDGKPFAFALRFACPGAASDVRANIEERGTGEDRTIRLTVRPDIGRDDPRLVHLVGTGAVEAASGFSIRRPWLLTAACPAVPTASPATAPAPAAEAAPPLQIAPASGQRIGLVQIFTVDDSRTGRRLERPYETVLTPQDSDGIAQSGFNLVLAGRLRAGPDGKVIRCSVSEPNRPPDCLILVRFDGIRMENPASGALLAQWAD